MSGKLTDEQIQEVWLALGRGESTQAVAEVFGVSKSCIQRQRNRLVGGQVKKNKPRRIVKCKGCPLLFISLSRGRTYHDADCKAKLMHREQLHRLEELKWLVGTDSWDNIARRLDFASRPALMQWLRRMGEEELANKMHEQSLASIRWGKAA